MGVILSSFSKLDNIINPESESRNEILPINTEPIFENTVSTEEGSSVLNELKTDMPKEPVLEPELTPLVENTLNTTEQLEVKEDTSNLGKKVDVMPVNISDTTDVIKKHTKKRRRHHMG